MDDGGFCGERCLMLDVLEAAVTRGTPVEFRTHSGEAFVDHVTDVITRAGEDYAILAHHEPLAVSRLAGCRPVP